MTAKPDKKRATLFQWPAQRFAQAFFLCAVGLLIYAQTFDDPFRYDDFVTIVNNQSVHYLPDVLATLNAVVHFQPTRFVTLLTYAVNFYAHQYDVFGYHLVNFAIHLMASFCVWWLGCLLGNAVSFLNEKGVRPHQNKNKTPDFTLVSFLGALLFLAHPVNTQAVSYLSQRYESLATLFYVITVCCYLQGRLSERHRLRFYSMAIVSALLGMCTKEITITLPLMIAFIEIYFFRKPEALGRKGQGKAKGLMLFFLVLLICAFVFIPGLLNFRYSSILFSQYPSQSHLGDILTLPTYLLTQLRVWAVFFKLLFVPVGLNFDYDFSMSQSLFEPETFGSFLLLSGLLITALKVRRQHPLLAFAIFWFFITLLANLIPRRHVIFEHKLYLVTSGVLPALCVWMSSAIKSRRVLIGILSVWIGIFVVLAYMRNTIWGSDIALWEDTLKKSPKKAPVYLNLGAAYASAGKQDLALKTLNQGIELEPRSPQAFNNRGILYLLKKDDATALENFNQALALDPGFYEGYVNRGTIYFRQNKIDWAMSDFNQVIAIRPTYSDGYRMRGRLYEAMRDFPSALKDYNQALAFNPADPQVLAWRGYLMALNGQMDLAMRDFNNALRLNPYLALAYVYRGMGEFEQGQHLKALEDFNKAISLEPELGIAYFQRARYYADTGMLDKAMKDINQAITLESDLDSYLALRARIYAQTKAFDKAIEDLNQCVKINPQLVDHYLNRGLIYVLLQKWDLAIVDFTSIIEMNPRLASAYNRRGGVYGRLKKFALAIADFSKAIELNPNSAIDYYNRSMIYREQGNRQNAIADARKAQALGFSVPEDYFDSLK